VDVGVWSTKDTKHRHAVLYLVVMVIAARFWRAGSFLHSGTVLCLHIGTCSGIVWFLTTWIVKLFIVRIVSVRRSPGRRVGVIGVSN
jgi:hypothetical protein